MKAIKLPPPRVRHPREARVFAEAQILTLKKPHPKTEMKHCNLCNQTFKAASPYLRFCDTCKAASELYHFSEWLPAA